MLRAGVSIGVSFQNMPRTQCCCDTVPPWWQWQQISRRVLRRYRPDDCCERPRRIRIEAPWLHPRTVTYELAGTRYRRQPQTASGRGGD